MYARSGEEYNTLEEWENCPCMEQAYQEVEELQIKEK